MAKEVSTAFVVPQRNRVFLGVFNLSAVKHITNTFSFSFCVIYCKLTLH